MGPVMNFVLALTVAATSLAGGSLLWPRLTTHPRPRLLSDVHDAVLRTNPGREAAQVLGVSDERHVEPINIGQIVGGAALGVKNAVSRRIQTVIVTNATNQLRGQFDKLSPEKKREVQSVICAPPQSTSSGSSVVE